MTPTLTAMHLQMGRLSHLASILRKIIVHYVGSRIKLSMSHRTHPVRMAADRLAKWLECLRPAIEASLSKLRKASKARHPRVHTQGNAYNRCN